MSKKLLPVFVPLVVLLSASLACSALSGGATSSLQATANAAFTQAASGAATAGIQDNSIAATAGAAATELVATANAATGGGATGQATDTPAAGQPTAAATTASGGGGGALSGGPQDIPVVSGDNTVLVASAQLVSYQSKSDFDTVVAFYKDAMPKNGWTADASASLETAGTTVLAFTKDTRHANVSVTQDPTSKQTIVLITIS